jgi:hypothetical protein
MIKAMKTSIEKDLKLINNALISKNYSCLTEYQDLSSLKVNYQQLRNGLVSLAKKRFNYDFR